MRKYTLAEQVQPPSKIDILEVGEEILVEATSIEKRRTGEKRRAGAGGKQRFSSYEPSQDVQNPCARSGR